MDKLNVDCIIRPRNDNSVLLADRRPALRSFFLDGICFALRSLVGWRRDVSVQGMIRQTNSPARCTNMIRGR